MSLMQTLLDRTRGGGLHERMTKGVSYTAGTGSERGIELRAGEAELTASAAAYRCVLAIAGNAASLDLGVRREDGELDKTHDVARLFNRRPNPMISARLFKEVLWSQLEWDGESFVYLDRGPTGTGTISEVWPIFDPVEVVVRKGKAGTEAFEGVRVKVGREKVPLLPSEVLWLRYPHPRRAWGALAPWRAASWAAELDAYARAWQKGELKNGARPEGVVYLGDVDEKVHQAAVEEFRSRHTGAGNAAKHIFASGPVQAKYDRIGLTPAEMSYLESRKINAEEMMLAFGVPKDYLLGGATYENRAASRSTLWSDAIVPKLEVVASEVDRQLLPDERETAEFDTSEVPALQEPMDGKVQRIGTLLEHDVLLIDEARAELGMDPLPGGLGQQTLTAFRGQTGMGLEAAMLAGALPAEQRQRIILAPAQRVAAAHARLRLGATEVIEGETVTRAKRRGPAPVDRKAVLRQYARMEAAGRKAVERLAEKQRTVVLRNLRRLRAKDATWQTRVAEAARRRHACAREDGSHVRTPHGRIGDLCASCHADLVHVREQVADLYDVAYWRDFTHDQLGGWVAQVYDGGAAMAGVALGIDFEVFDTQVTAAMARRLDTLAGQVTDTTAAAIEQELLREGVEEGESIPDLADRLTARFDTLSTSRAETIARTETVGGTNEAGRTAAVSSGLVAARQWLATNDERVRDSHQELDGHTTNGMDDPYPNGCMFPGDPAGDPAETINCRCTETWVLTDDDEGNE